MTATEMCSKTSPRTIGGETIRVHCEKSAKHAGPHLAGGYTWTIDAAGHSKHTKIVHGSVL